MARPDDAASRGGGDVRVVVVRDEQGALGAALEAELPLPGEVLDGEERGVGKEEEVARAVAEDDVAGGVDDAREDGLAPRAGDEGGIDAACEDGGGGGVLAVDPGCVGGCVQGGFDFGEVEVGGGKGRGEGEGAR